MRRLRTLQIIRTDGRHCLALLIAVFATVLLAAAGAQAEGLPAGGEEPQGREVGAGAPEVGTGSPEVGAGSPETPPAGEGGAEAPAGAGGETEGPPEMPVAEPPETQVVPPSTEPVEEALPPPPPSDPVEEVLAGVPPAEGPEPAPAAPAGEAAEEPAPGKARDSSEEGEAAGDGSLAHPSTPAVLAAETQDASAHAGLLGEPAASAPTATSATVTAQVAEISGQAGASPDRPLKHGAESAGSQAGRFSCELSAFGGSATENCTAGWLGAPRENVSASADVDLAAVSSLITGSIPSPPGGGGHDGSAISSQPLTSAPGPAPSGTSGAATGAAGSGVGVSIFLTLAGLLLLGAPRVLRRLGLSFEPWLAGCFVLIPEHPD